MQPAKRDVTALIDFLHAVSTVKDESLRALAQRARSREVRYISVEELAATHQSTNAVATLPHIMHTQSMLVVQARVSSCTVSATVPYEPLDPASHSFFNLGLFRCPKLMTAAFWILAAALSSSVRKARTPFFSSCTSQIALITITMVYVA